MGLHVRSYLVVGARAKRHEIWKSITKYNVDSGAPYLTDVATHEWRIGEHVIPMSEEDYEFCDRLLHEENSEGSIDAIIGLKMLKDADEVDNGSRFSGIFRVPDNVLIDVAKTQARAELLVLGYDGPVDLFVVTRVSV